MARGSSNTSWATSQDTGAGWSTGWSVGGLAATAALLAWFASLARGRTPRGLRDLIVYAIGYTAQVVGYVLLVTDRYPTSDPARIVPDTALPPHPVRLALTDRLERSRLTVFFRFLLTIPHLIWLLLWTVLAVLAVFVAWLVALVIGRVPMPLHRFIAAWVRYSTHVMAFLFLIGGPFPGFVGAAGSYPVDLAIDPPVRQRRLVTLFRGLLAIPALLLGGAYSAVVLIAALLGWWAALFTGRMPEGLRNIGAVGLRYSGQASSYLFLLTDRYPYSAPAVRDRDRDEQLVLPIDEPAGPTADRNRAGLNRTVRVIVAAAALAVWLVCASLLLRTAVPSGLHLPRVDADAVFGKALVRQTVHVERFFLFTWVLGQIALFATLWIYARRGPRFARESAAGPIGTGMLLGMLGLGLVWLIQLPFTLLDVWWARRYDLTESGYLEWALGHWFELGGAFVSLCIALLVVMFLARWLGEIWWIPGAFVFVAIGAGFAFAQPYLAATKPLKDPAAESARRRSSSRSRASPASRSASRT